MNEGKETCIVYAKLVQCLPPSFLLGRSFEIFKHIWKRRGVRKVRGKVRSKYESIRKLWNFSRIGVEQKIVMLAFENRGKVGWYPRRDYGWINFGNLVPLCLFNADFLFYMVGTSDNYKHFFFFEIFDFVM